MQSCWPQRDDELRRLWAEGLSTLAIAERMRLTKNSVIGRAHRLGLPARHSPIRPRDPDAPRPPPKAKRAPAATLAPLPPVEMPEAPPPPAYIRRPAACCWPIGEPRTPGFRYCEAGTAGGATYCAEHAARAYVRLAAREEAA